MAQNKGWQDLGRKLGFCTALLLFFIAIFPVGDWMLLPLENRFAPVKLNHVDGIVVLGSDENAHISEMRNQPTLRSGGRYLEFVSLARQYAEAKLVYSGGSGLLTPDAKMKNAEVAKQAFATMGIRADRVTFENQSRNTYENAVLTGALMHVTKQQNWLLVTSAWHMPRAIGAFRKAGWNVYAAPADYKTDGRLSSELHFDLADHLLKMTVATHEYYGLIAYWLLGYMDELWPK